MDSIMSTGKCNIINPTCRETAHTRQTLDPVLHFTLAATLKVVVSGLVATFIDG